VNWIIWDKTSRGFSVGTFRDKAEQECSIQESSSIDVAIWFGADDILWSREYDAMRPYERDGSTYRHVNGRMHLSQEQAAQIWPILRQFAETGFVGTPADQGSLRS
jgi:hypothetical protein